MVPKYNKILIIDDNYIDNYITSAIIKKNNLANNLVEFDNGLKAIEYLEQNKDNDQELPDLILLDLYMPLMDGFEFLNLFEKIDSTSTKKCKICIVSSSIDDNDIIKAKLDKNIYTFVSKPLTAELLNSL
ncbi:two-component system response regulator [Flavobacterium sp.]|jgi:CheY-like chemotaxis protein|uniref:response regulator n=1 Tax=Flavobacterium sp. TaxID=239 RepID=UPI000EE56088|nr:response regulator [Flavobacterium sp.]HCQ12925.1 response regulator [Flavobacterium sp.]